ncbi:MAG TPA: ATP synthase F1 subunit delta [Phycisphaerales bacterium]|nr:ATP synthase F1 subunit delta [Phycisphaerales bacterium]HMP37959.1 ATP synthase F1 subunit delta [Phycisphaerales bacterium]
MPTNTVDAVALSYARALFQLAESAGGRPKLEEIADELEQLIELIRADRRFGEFVTSPILDRQRRAEALRRILNGRVTDLLLRFVLVLGQKGRLGHIEAIARAYDALMQESFGRVEVDVITAVPVEAAQLESIRALVQGAIGREPVLHRSVDPTMLGGIKLRIGDQLIDGSVAGRLRRIRDSVVAGSGAVRENLGRIVTD